MEVTDILSTLGLENVKDIDGFKKAVNEKFITKSQAADDDDIKSKITGKVTGAATTLIKREFELSNDEIKDKKWEDILLLGVQKLKDKNKELETLATSGNDDKLKDITTKFEKKSKEADDFKALLESTKQTLTQKETEWNGTLKNIKTSTVFEKGKEKVMPKLKSDLSEAEKFYFESKVKEKFSIDFDDKDEVLVIGKDGKRLANPNKVGAFLSLEEAMELEAESLGLVKKNNGSGIDPTKIFTKPEQQVQVQTGRTIHPNALKHAEQLKAQK
jgi:hypothetical protein